MSNTAITGRIAPVKTIAGSIRIHSLRGRVNAVPARNGVTIMTAIGFAGLAGIHARTGFAAAHMSAAGFAGFDGTGASTEFDGAVMSANGTLATSE